MAIQSAQFLQQRSSSAYAGSANHVHQLLKCGLFSDDDILLVLHHVLMLATIEVHLRDCRRRTAQ
jgi:hypothetical protein